MKVERHDDEPSWLAARQTCIGSSDAPTILGVGYKSALELWAEKTGKVEPKPSSLRMRVGHFLEEGVSTLAEEALGKRLVDPGHYTMFLSDERPWQAATVDRLIYHDLPGDPIPGAFGGWLEDAIRSHRLDGIVELKTVSSMAAKNWEDTPHLYALAQVAHQQAVTGMEEAHIAALIGLGDDLRVWPVERNEELIAALVEAEERFWECVQRDIPPPPDASEGAKEALSLLYPRSSGHIIQLGSEYLPLIERLETAKLEMKDAEERRRAAENELKALIGEAEGVDVEGAPVIYKWSQTRRVDPPRLEERVVEFRTLRAVKR